MKHIILFTICYSLFAGYGQGSGRALAFDGNDWVELPLMTTLNGRQQCSFSCWVQYGDPAVNQTLFTHWVNSVQPVGDNIGFYASLYGNRMYAHTSAGLYMQTAATPFVTGQWYHVAVVFDGSQSGDANRLKMYVNGEQQAVDFSAQIVPVPATIGNRAVITHIGARRNNSNALIDYVKDGKLDEMAVWTRALSQTEIRHKMCQHLTGAEPGLVAYWRMDEGTDNTCSATADVCDQTGNGHHGTKF